MPTLIDIRASGHIRYTYASVGVATKLHRPTCQSANCNHQQS